MGEDDRFGTGVSTKVIALISVLVFFFVFIVVFGLVMIIQVGVGHAVILVDPVFIGI